ncbi:Receptor-like protein kinase HSL1 [Striga hermonthica]|uniref:non-specific serine/threonine protein kinase n=1 Tax=Striga hermonthica TaxID=68872 RepID=A0A9N7MUT5_STRHE|nr:Receptor-like protein kinase HSL1 [Striga hermonthica]
MQRKFTSVLLLLTYLCALTVLHQTRRSLALTQDGLVLQEVRRSLFDPNGALAGWSAAAGPPCSWFGVGCDGLGRVVSVSLPGASLAGPFPLALCRLPFLSNLSLADNYINGSLPLSISGCRSLVHLDLSQNLIHGSLPPTLADLHFLRYLNLLANNFYGDIPAYFGRFERLESLILIDNLLNSTIPAALGNITTLKDLQLAYNPFSPGPIPDELGNLTNLENLWLTYCQLVGPIPGSLARLTQLRNLDLAVNRLSGPIPGKIIMGMTRIEQIELFNNSFTGNLPSGWSNLTMLRRFDASMNELTGVIPDELCKLPLESLILNDNRLEGIIPDSIASSPNLNDLNLFKNGLWGNLPSDLGKNSPLQVLDVSSNNLSGEIPEFLCLNGALENLILMVNAFKGTIPESLGKCRSLLRVRLRDNRLQGEVPPQFWGLPRVYFLELSGNAFSGNIPSSIRGAKNLSILAVSNNRFSGSIPSEIELLDALINFAADGNSLSGEIPSSILNLRQLGRLDLSSNNFSGGIPTGIKSLKLLNELNLANNHLSGHIPDELGGLPVLNYLDLSNNNFSGEIPVSLQNLKLNKLNLSRNMLSGELPPLFSNGAYRDSFLENPGLCFYNSNSCNRNEEKANRVFSWVLKSIFITTGLVFLVGIVWFLLRYRKLKQTAEGVATITKWTSFHKLGFSELEISSGLKETNVIGRGASGKVYKVILSNGEAVAVKKLHDTLKNDENDPFPSEFEVEVDTLGKIRHKNIVKLWSCCDAGDCKLLVYEYMPNGSLRDLLHGNKSRLLDWPTRFSIVLGAAEGLSYLHHDCDPPIVHRDVKSNNLLLDEDFGAKISDFGVAKVVKEIENRVESMSVIAGSCGYIAPEYAYTMRVNEKSDIYSFGIVILELVTRKLPTDPEFGDKGLATWVYTTLGRDGLDRVIDPELDSSYNEHICKVLDIGLVCVSKHPTSRPSMRRVVAMLYESGAGMSNNSVKEKDNGKLLP